MSRSSLLLGCILLSCLLGACRHSEAPTPEQLTHPSGTTSTRISGLGGRPFGVRVASNGDVLLTEQDLNLSVHLDSLGTRFTNIGVGRDPGDVVVNRAATVAYVSGFFDGTVSFVNLATNAVTQTVTVSTTNAYRLALSSDDSRLYVTSTDGHLYSVNTSTAAVNGSAPLAGALQGLALNRTGSALYVTATSGAIWRIDPASLTVVKSGALANCQAQDVAVATDDSEGYVACENGSVVVIDPTTLVVKTTINVSGAPFGLVVARDNAQLYVSSPTSGSLTIIDRASRALGPTLPLSGVPRRLALNAHGNKLYVANEGNWIDVIE